MDLNKLIPNNDSNWSISGKFVMFKKLQKIPVCVFENGIIYVFLENKISNQILKFTKNLLRLKYEFYFTTPLYSNPSGVDNLKEEVVNSYLYSYTNETFFYGLKK